MRARTETTAHLDAEIASVDIIPQEEITRGLRVSTDLEEFHQVILGRRARISTWDPKNEVMRLTYCP